MFAYMQGAMSIWHAIVDNGGRYISGESVIISAYQGEYCVASISRVWRIYERKIEWHAQAAEVR